VKLEFTDSDEHNCILLRQSFLVIGVLYLSLLLNFVIDKLEDSFSNGGFKFCALVGSSEV